MSGRLCSLLVLLLPTVAWAQINVSPAALAKLKESTVFICVDSDMSKLRGSGCLFKKKGKTGYVLTNAHVVRPRGGRTSSIDVVFYSGTDKEKIVKGDVAALDKQSDLAVIQVEMEDLPAGITRVAKGAIKETTPVCVLGFPFGEALSPTQRNPAVTVSQATVSSLRKDDSGDTLRIQLDGEINPGNSGGPVVDANGNLIGIAANTVKGSGIGFAIPAEHLERVLAGDVREVVLAEIENLKGRLKLRAEVELIDPLRTITQVGLIVAPADKAARPSASRPSGADRREGAGLLKGGTSHRLPLKNGKASGTISITPSGQTKAAYLVQVKYVGRDKKWKYTEPRAVEFSLFHDRPKKEKKTEKSEEADDEPNEPGPEAADATTKTPGPIEDLALAGGGRYILLKLKGIPGLALYDIYKAEITDTLRLPGSEFLFAAGGRTAVVYFPSDNVFQSLDLKSRKKTKTKPNPVPAKIKGIVMGHSRSDQAVVYFDGTGGNYPGNHFLLDTASLEPVMDGDKPYYWHNNRAYGDQPNPMRADGGLNYLVEWCSGIGVASRTGNRFSFKYDHNSHGSTAVGDDGFLYCADGNICSMQLVKVGSVGGQALFPALGGSFFVGMSESGDLTIFPSGKTTPVCKWGRFPSWTKEHNNRRYAGPGDLSFDKRIIFAPAAGRIVFIPVENDRIELRKFDLKTTLDESGIDYLVVVSSPKTQVKLRDKWEYQMQVLSKAGEVKYKLEFAPEGMTISDAGLITWKVPNKLGEEGEKVVVLISDKAGEQTYHTFSLTGGAGTGGGSGQGTVHRITYRE